MNYNIIPRASNTPRLYPSQNGYINYSFNNENNRYAIPYQEIYQFSFFVNHREINWIT